VFEQKSQAEKQFYENQNKTLLISQSYEIKFYYDQDYGFAELTE